jgi:predicted Zn-dependent protease
MIKDLLNLGKSAGFEATEVCWEKSKKTIFESLEDHYADHSVESNNAAIRVFYKGGNPAGVRISNPSLSYSKTLFSNLSTQNIPVKGINFSPKLPGQARKIKVDIFDNTIQVLNNSTFKELVEQIYEHLCSYSDLKIKKISLVKEELKKYLGNSKGLNIKYRKTLFTLMIKFVFKDNIMDVVEAKTHFGDLEPVTLLSRTFSLINSITKYAAPYRKNCMMILSPEASTLIMKELAPCFKLSQRDQIKPPKAAFPPILNIVDHPLMDRQAGSVPFDDEGVQSDEKFLIKKGYFKRYISNLNEAHKHNLASTGNGFRSSKSIFPQINFGFNSNICAVVFRISSSKTCKGVS